MTIDGCSVSVIVEFTGLPGSGKSFLAAALVDALSATGGPAELASAAVGPEIPRLQRLARKATLAARAAVSAPRSTAAATVAIARSGQPLQQTGRRVQNWLVTNQLQRQARRRPGVHVFDQGLVQELHSLAYQGTWRGALPTAGPGPGRLGPDLLVAVRVPAEVCAARLERRVDANSRLDRMTPPDRCAWLAARHAELLEITEAWLAAHGTLVPTRLLVLVNADDSPSALAELTRQMLAAVRAVG